MKGFDIHKPTTLHGSKTMFSKRFPSSTFFALWKNIFAKIQGMENKFYKNTISAVVQFVQSSAHLQTFEIPAGVIHLGVNVPDHSRIFQQLNSHLKSDGNYPITLDPKNCHNMFQVLQLIEKSLGKCFALKEKKVKPIVFVIQDVETFNFELLEEIILRLKPYIQRLPVVLIFGMSSKMVTLHSVLPHKVLCHLGIEIFQPFAVAEHLTDTIQEVLMSPLPFKLGPKVFQLVVDTVFYHDFSTSNLMHLLKFSLFEHFYDNQASALCCPKDVMKQQIHSLKDEELLIFKQLPSMKLYLQKTPEASTCLAKNREFKLLLENLIESLFQCFKTFVFSLKILSQLLKDSPDDPIKNQFCELYLLQFDKCSHDKIFRNLEKSFKFQSQKEILSNFNSWERDLDVRDSCPELFKLLEKSFKMISSTEDFENSFQQNSQESFGNRYEMQKKMQARILLKQSKFRSICSKVLNDLTNYFKNLCSPMHLPLHEIMFFDDAVALKSHLLPSPRLLLCSTLSHPYDVFKHLSCRAGGVIDYLPDACILYSLLLECGRLINLQDWNENFKAACGDRTKLKKISSKNEVYEDFLIIRFLHSASELQLLGFTKMAKQKKHHVIRLVFNPFFESSYKVS